MIADEFATKHVNARVCIQEHSFYPTSMSKAWAKVIGHGFGAVLVVVLHPDDVWVPDPDRVAQTKSWTIAWDWAHHPGGSITPVIFPEAKFSLVDCKFWYCLPQHLTVVGRGPGFEIKLLKNYPQTCTCGAPAYIGIAPVDIDCSSETCRHHRKIP